MCAAAVSTVNDHLSDTELGAVWYAANYYYEAT